jgi:hypothetical protein
MKRRFLLDSDGSNLFPNMSTDWRREIDEAVRECAPNVTTYMMCSGAGTMYFPTKAADVRPGYDVLRAAHARGEDPFGETLRALKASGKETFISYRVNDVHNPTEEWNKPRFRREHPDCIVGAEEVRQGKAQWMSYCMNFALPEVRAYVLAVIREQIELYGSVIDGFQLDWLRFPRYLAGGPEEVWAQRGVLTEFTAEVRAALDASGRRILLAARVPTSLAGCRRVGLDVGEWARRKSVDFIVASPFLTTDFAMPLGEMRAAMGAAAVPIYGAFDLSHSGQIHNPESMRAAASGLYDCGAEGIYVFNFPCWIERLGARPYHWLAGLERPETAAAKPLLFSVAHRTHRVGGGIDLPHALPCPLPAGGMVDLPLPLPKAALPAWRCLVAVAVKGDVALAVNGRPAPERPGPRRAELFVEYYPKEKPGEKPRPRPGDEESRLFDVPAEALRAGENVLTVSSRATCEVTVERVNVGLW